MEQLDKKKTTDNSLRNNRIRSSIYSLGGFYALYMAYCSYRDISVTSGNTQILNVVFTLLLAVGGLVFMLIGFGMLYKYSKKPAKQEEDTEE